MVTGTAPSSDGNKMFPPGCVSVNKWDTDHHIGTHFAVKMCVCGVFDADHVNACFSKTAFELVVLNLCSFHNDFWPSPASELHPQAYIQFY